LVCCLCSVPVARELVADGMLVGLWGYWRSTSVGKSMALSTKSEGLVEVVVTGSVKT
jgi:hypothetical protein